MVTVAFHEAEPIGDSLLEFAVIASRHHGRWVFCKHKKRSTWEVPGGHREPPEPIIETARRELFEETGAKEFQLTPVCVYSVTMERQRFGMLYYAEIESFGPLPESEIERIQLFDDMPEQLTYPLIQPKLINKANAYIHQKTR